MTDNKGIEMNTLFEQHQKCTNTEALLPKQQNEKNCLSNFYRSLFGCCFKNKEILLQQEIQKQKIEIEKLRQQLQEQTSLFQDEKTKDEKIINNLSYQNEALKEELKKKSQKPLNQISSQISQLQLRVNSSQQQQIISETMTSYVNTYPQAPQQYQQFYNPQNNITQTQSLIYDQQNQQFYQQLSQQNQQQQQFKNKKNIKILGTVNTTQTIHYQPQSQSTCNQYYDQPQSSSQFVQQSQPYQSSYSQSVQQTQSVQFKNQKNVDDSLRSDDNLDVLKTQVNMQSCFRCQNQISGSQIQTNCYHNYHEQCFQEMIQTQVFNEQLTAVQCLCQKKLKIQILFNLSYEQQQKIQDQIYKNQIQIIKKDLSNQGKIQQCQTRNCSFFYISFKCESSFCLNCEK